MDFSSIDVIILCGGLGRRLGALLQDLPKPMIPVDGKPFLEILIERVRDAGFRRFILCAGFRGAKIRDELRVKDADILFSQETQPLGTGGALRHCKRLIRSADVLVMNGDSVCPALDYSALFELHRRSGRLVTAVVSAAGDRSDGGFVQLGPESEVLAFSEKTRPSGGAAYVNAGVYVFGQAAFERLPGKTNFSLETEFFPSLSPREFSAFPTESPLFDVGTPERLDSFRRSHAGVR